MTSAYLSMLLCINLTISYDGSPKRPFLGFLREAEDKPNVTIAFERFPEGWKLAATPAAVTWDVTLHGKKIGNLKSRSVLKKEHLSTQNHISNDSEIIKVGERTLEYSGWLGKPIYRPLVLVTRGSSGGDPDGWIERQNTGVGEIVQQFMKDFNQVTNCSPTDPDLPADQNFHYTKEQVKIVTSYKSAAGELIQGLRLDGSINKCDGLLDGAWLDQWYYIGKNGRNVLHLGSEMVPLDAGDYDGDGSSEFIFFVQGENYDGYTLFWEQFRHSISYTWTYH